MTEDKSILDHVKVQEFPNLSTQGSGLPEHSGVCPACGGLTADQEVSQTHHVSGGGYPPKFLDSIRTT